VSSAFIGFIILDKMIKNHLFKFNVFLRIFAVHTDVLFSNPVVGAALGRQQQII